VPDGYRDLKMFLALVKQPGLGIIGEVNSAFPAPELAARDALACTNTAKLLASWTNPPISPHTCSCPGQPPPHIVFSIVFIPPFPTPPRPTPSAHPTPQVLLLEKGKCEHFKL
jgi:hypothetical protein